MEECQTYCPDAELNHFALVQKEIASIMKPDGVLVFVWNNEKSVESRSPT